MKVIGTNKYEMFESREMISLFKYGLFQVVIIRYTFSTAEGSGTTGG